MPFLGWVPVFFKFTWIPKLLCFSPCDGLLTKVNSNHASLHLCSLGLQGSPGPHRRPSLACPAESRRQKMAGALHDLFIKAHSKCSQNFPTFLYDFRQLSPLPISDVWMIDDTKSRKVKCHHFIFTYFKSFKCSFILQELFSECGPTDCITKAPF